MFIRCTTTRSNSSGDPYKTFRLVESERVGGKVKQRTLINLGRHFDVPKSLWSDLSCRISELLSPQQSLIPIELSVQLETMAQRYAAQLIATRSQLPDSKETFELVSIDSLELIRPRRVGIEQLALHALMQLRFDKKLKALGFNQHQLAAALGNIVARMAFPTSELASYDWLQNRSALGELIDYDYEGMGLDRLYQASDQLSTHVKLI